jgi:hypothetical protein
VLDTLECTDLSVLSLCSLCVLSVFSVCSLSVLCLFSRKFEFLVASLCPSIVGNHLVKAGLLLALFGGTTNDGLDEKNR